MPIYASAGSGTKFQPAPAGTHAAVCCDVRDLGVLAVEFQGEKKMQHKILISWQIAEDRDDGKPFMVSKRYTLSLHERASLRKDLESWRGRPFTETELEKFDVETVVGKPCLLSVVHRSQGGDTYANVQSIMSLPKGMFAPTVRDYVRFVDREPEQQQEPEHVPPVTADDIPFSWAMPLILPALAAFGGVLA